MMRVMKQNIVIILLLSMIVSMFPAQVLAVEVELEKESPVSTALPNDSALEKSAEAADDSALDKMVTAAGVPSAEKVVTPEDMVETRDTETAADEPEDEASLLARTLTYGNLQYTVSGNNVTITGCDTSISSAVIPSQINGVTVTSIGSEAFFGCSSLTSIIIPNSVTSIGYRSFYGCNRLTNLTIPNSVTSIGDQAFFGCSSLTSITIPNSVTSIGNMAFAHCSSLTSTTIPDSVTSIGDWTFSDCSSLTSIIIPNSVTSIGDRVFYGCSKLTTAGPIGGNYDYQFGWDKSIPNYAFSVCNSLTNITIPNGVTSIGDWTFWGCSSLTNITIPNSVTSIGDYAFTTCSSLTNITIPNSVTSIGDSAFAFCSSLTSVTIPNGVTSIGNDAFYGCSSLSIYCQDNSHAKQYAIDYNIPFILGDFQNDDEPSNPGQDDEPGSPPVNARTIQSVTITRENKVYNLLTTKQNFEKDSSESASVVVTVNWGSSPAGRILLSQGSANYLESTDGNFGTIVPGKTFTTGEYIYAIAVNANGDILESKRIFLQITEPVVDGNVINFRRKMWYTEAG